MHLTRPRALLALLAAVFLGAAAFAQQNASRTLTILATADEHGWLEPLMPRKADAYQGGMAYFFGQLLAKEHYRPAGMLLLSSGDMWTGPYESTVLQGRPMVQVMNAMAYDAAAVGNHDLDFGQEVLARRASEASFPFLAANLYLTGTDRQPPMVKPFALLDVEGIKVGVVGLMTLETPFTTDQRNLVGLSFGPYLEAIQREVPRARAAGAQFIVVMAHADIRDLKPLSAELRALGVGLVLGGHRHVGALEMDDGGTALAHDVLFCNPGPHARSYCKAVFQLDAQGRTQSHQASLELVAGANIKKPVYPPNDGVQAIIAEAKNQADIKGGEVLADVPEGLHRNGAVNTLGYVLVDSWLAGIPNVDFAVTNMGGLRQDIEGGQVKMRDVVGALPFDNYLLVVKLTGHQLREVMQHPQSIPGGMTVEAVTDANGTRTVTHMRNLKGEDLALDRNYRVVVNDFMYRGGDRYRLREFDTDPEETSLHWRDPLVRYLKEAAKTGKPLAVPQASRFSAP